MNPAAEPDPAFLDAWAEAIADVVLEWLAAEAQSPRADPSSERREREAAA